MSTNDYDAIVVGSGITGGWAAKELTERGLKTLLLERGRHVEHIKDYVSEHVPSYKFKFQLLGDRRLYASDYPVQSQTTFFNEGTQHFFVNDRNNPYTHPADKPFTWIRGHQLGGRSLMWGRQAYRLAPLNFEENAQDGHGVDWPIRYEDLAPWYAYVEKFIGVSGSAINHPMSPDGVFQKPYPMNVVEQDFARRMAKLYPDRPVTMARAANLTEPLGDRAPCHYCGICERGCSPGSYFSTLSSTLPAAQATGRLTLKTDSIVHSIVYDEKSSRAQGVRVMDANTKTTREYTARIVVLCASAFESVRLLLNSAPNGLANSSGVLGHYIMDHLAADIMLAEVDGPATPNYTGARPVPLHVPRFRNVHDKRKDYVRGYQLNAGAAPQYWQRGLRTPGFGADFKNSLREAGPWQLMTIAQCECLPRKENYLAIDPDVKDAWGIPALRITMSYGDNEFAMAKEAGDTLHEMFTAGRYDNITRIEVAPVPGMSIHEMGGAPMGRDPKTSVLNAFNQCHDVPNLLLTDGAAMNSSSSANPSLTYMALTARACAHAVEELKRGNI